MHTASHGDATSAPGQSGKARAMVARAFLAQNVAVGSAFGGFGVSVLPLQQKYGASAGATGLILALCVLVLGLISPLVGNLIGRIGLRWTMMAGTMISGLGYLLLAYAPSITVVQLLYALPIGAGLAMFGPFPSSVLASNWNARNPGLALGIANTPLFAALLPMLGMMVIREQSLSAFYLVLAGLHLALLPVLLGVSDGPADATHRPDSHGHVAHAMAPWGAILRSPRFWVMALGAGFLNAVGISGVSHLGPFAAERGIAPAESAMLLSIMGGAAVAGSLIVGALCSRLGALRALALVAAVLGTSWGILMATTTFPLLAGATLLVGACGAGVFPAVNIISGKLFGQDSLPRAVGAFALVTLPVSFGLPPISGLIHDAMGNYVPVITIFVVGCLAVAAVFGLSGRAGDAPVAAAAA